MAGESEDIREDAIEEDVEVETDEEEVIEDRHNEDAPVRRSSALKNEDFARIRVASKGKKEKTESEDDDEVELTPKARAAIRSELSPVIETLKKQADDLELREYLSSHPEKAKFEKAIRNRMEKWPSTPVSEIGKTVGSEEVIEDRNEKREQAKEKASGKRLGGTSNRAQEAKLPTEADHAEIYKQMKQGKQLNLETGQYEQARR